MRTKQSRRAFMRLIGLICVLLLLFSFALVFIEAGHVCRGDDCPVCALLRSALGGGKAGVPAALCFFIATLCAPVFLRFLPGLALRRRTPVHEKIRLND